MISSQMKIRHYPLARALYIKYCRTQDPEILKYIYSEDDDHNALAACAIRESYVQKVSSHLLLQCAILKWCFLPHAFHLSRFFQYIIKINATTWVASYLAPLVKGGTQQWKN